MVLYTNFQDVFEGHFILLAHIMHEYLQGLTAVDFTHMDVSIN